MIDITTIAELAREFGMTVPELLSYANLLDGTTEISQGDEDIIREGISHEPAMEPSVIEQNAAEDAVLADLYEITEHAGYDY